MDLLNTQGWMAREQVIDAIATNFAYRVGQGKTDSWGMGCNISFTQEVALLAMRMLPPDDVLNP